MGNEAQKRSVGDFVCLVVEFPIPQFESDEDIGHRVGDVKDFDIRSPHSLSHRMSMSVFSTPSIDPVIINGNDFQTEFFVIQAVSHDAPPMIEALA